MNCIKCGTRNDSDAEYCENCGTPLKQVCADCGNSLKSDAKFCNKCGKPITITTIVKEKEEHLAVLQKAAPAELKKKIQAVSRKSEGERKPVTILFTDIVGSTAIAEKLDPEEWKEIVSSAHRYVSQAVYRYEGTIAQLLGDGVLAFFGAPITHEDDPVRAVRAAIDIQFAITEYARQLQGYVDDFQMRIGINTGLVVITNIGTDLHMEYLAIGDAVNLAARLQSTARPGKVLLSENTARLVSAVFKLQPLGEIAVKGKAEPVNAFEVVESKTTRESRRGFEELVSPLVGRDHELALLCIALKSLQEGHGQVVSVIGEAGIGKSRLVEDARKQTMFEGSEDKTSLGQHFHWIEGRALSYGQTLSFWTITQLIKNDLELSDGDPEPKVRAALRRRVNTFFGEHGDEVLPYLGNLLGVKLEGELAERLQVLDGETVKRQTLLSISRYFEQIAKAQPTVLVFEDLHWADPSSIQALLLLASLTDQVPLLLLVLFRPDRDLPSWGVKLQLETDYPHRYTEIILHPLTFNDQNQLVDNLLAIADLSLAVRQAILERAEGNPFYLEEIVRSMIDQGGIVREGDHWRATQQLLDISIPDTLQGVLLARIDRLQEDVRRTLQLAAVIGKSFLFCLLEAIAEAEQQLNQHLAQLQRADLVREKTRLPELEYMFKHSLTQEAAYNSLLIEKRIDFHQRVGQALENLFADRKEEFLGLLAHHFDAANEREKAIDYLIQAGDKARLADEHTEAINFYRRACELLSEMGDERGAARVWLKLGTIYQVNFQFESAHHAYKQAFFLQQRVGMHAQTIPGLLPRSLRVCNPFLHITLDPGQATWAQDYVIINNLFSGLVEIDADLNVLPNVAHSWQVTEGGKRYLFHLRDDVFWTDGTPVTAQDFEWTWKRNLHPDFESDYAMVLFNVRGAQDYHEKRNADTNSIGVHALDDLTLEVCLVEPVAYFPYILSLPVTYPLPRKVIEDHGVDWWQAGNMISNGAFRLVEFDAKRGGVMERNPSFHGEFPGNLQRMEWIIIGDPAERLRMYQENLVDLVYMHGYETAIESHADEKYKADVMALIHLVFFVNSPPLDDLRVRKALSLALDRKTILKLIGDPLPVGGLIPPSMPGHSPEVGQGFDIDKANEYLAEAGYPGGQGFPSLTGLIPAAKVHLGAEISRQWRAHLGIDVSFTGLEPPQIRALHDQGVMFPCLIMGLLSDYPDPDCILGQVDLLDLLHYGGWRDAGYDMLIKEAARTIDRAKRMSMYRQADRFLVNEQALVIPLSYSMGDWFVLRKPWVKNYRMTPLGRELWQNVVVEDH